MPGSLSLCPNRALQPPTPTETPTTNHFQCHEVDRPFDVPFPVIPGVTLSDEFGTRTVNVIRPKRLCNPADKNDEDPTAPTDPEHLMGYEIRQTGPRFEKVRDQVISNQFGTITADLRKPELLLVPTAKEINQSPAPLPPDALNHFTCYRLHGARFRKPGLTVVDQLGTFAVAIKAPYRLCIPTDKNQEASSTRWRRCCATRCAPIRDARRSPGRSRSTTSSARWACRSRGRESSACPRCSTPVSAGMGSRNNFGEECDPPDDSECEGICAPDCTCPVQ